MYQLDVTNTAEKKKMLYNIWIAGISRTSVTNNAFIFLFFLQEEVTEDDIDDSFKSMFAQLAGEVGSLVAIIPADTT